jgi:ADP-ribose pyrophosphatase
VGAFGHLGDRLAHQGHIWHVAVGTFHAPDGSIFERDIVRSPGAVAAAPLRWRNGVPMITLVSQYRAPFDATVIEIPAGMRDIPGEPPDVTAHRELREEAGLVAAAMRPLVHFYPSAGMTDSVLHLFLATGLSDVDQDVHGPEEEAMTVFEVSVDDAMGMVLDGRIRDAKTVLAVLLIERMITRGELGAD